MQKNKEHIVLKYLKGDKVIWGTAFLLATISILVVYSAVSAPAFKFFGGNTEKFLIKHVIFVFAALGAMWVTHMIPYRAYDKLSRGFLFLAIVLLIITLAFGVDIHGARRWLIIPIVNIQFQPSDFAKFALISNLASMLAKRQGKIEDQTLIWQMILWVVVVVGLIAVADFSGAMLLFGTCMVLLYIGRVPLKIFAQIVMGGLAVLSVAFVFGQRGQTAISRVDQWINGVENSNSANIVNSVPDQLQYAYMAIARGGLTGVGPGNSTMRYFLPEAFSDFVFPICIEEYGMILGIVIMIIYLIIMFRGMSIASRSATAFGGLLAIGLSFSLAFQGLVNMAVAVGVLPVTGLPLPFISMGGTSFIFTGMSLGIIISVYRGYSDLADDNIEGNAIKKAEKKNVKVEQ
mgnify:CR=1 FL=1|tara:strand:+ start:1390 stop:2601 length:1212 start_codon:yes stop_codon:yes gene_type:complete